jgi:hypothetical protein
MGLADGMGYQKNWQPAQSGGPGTWDEYYKRLESLLALQSKYNEDAGSGLDDWRALYGEVSKPADTSAVENQRAEAINASQADASRAATARASAMGFGRSGASQAGQTAIASRYAGIRANAIRDAQQTGADQRIQRMIQAMSLRPKGPQGGSGGGGLAGAASLAGEFNPYGGSGVDAGNAAFAASQGGLPSAVTNPRMGFIGQGGGSPFTSSEQKRLADVPVGMTPPYKDILDPGRKHLADKFKGGL